MLIGTLIKEYCEKNNTSYDEFAAASGLSLERIEKLVTLYKPGTQEALAVAIRELKCIGDVIGQAVPMLMIQLGKEQPIEVNVMADSDQPHM